MDKSVKFKIELETNGEKVLGLLLVSADEFKESVVNAVNEMLSLILHRYYFESNSQHFDDPTMFSPDKITKGYEYMKSKTSKDIQVHRIICIINSAKGLEIKIFEFG